MASGDEVGRQLLGTLAQLLKQEVEVVTGVKHIRTESDSRNCEVDKAAAGDVRTPGLVVPALHARLLAAPTRRFDAG